VKRVQALILKVMNKDREPNTQNLSRFIHCGLFRSSSLMRIFIIMIEKSSQLLYLTLLLLGTL